MYNRSAGKLDFGLFRWLLQFCLWMWWLVLRGTIIFAQQALTAVWPSAEMKIDWMGECWLGVGEHGFDEVELEWLARCQKGMLRSLLRLYTWKVTWDGKWSVVSMAATWSDIWLFAQSSDLMSSSSLMIYDYVIERYLGSNPKWFSF